MLKKQDLGINPYVVNNGSRDQSLTGIGGPRVTLKKLGKQSPNRKGKFPPFRVGTSEFFQLSRKKQKKFFALKHFLEPIDKINNKRYSITLEGGGVPSDLGSVSITFYFIFKHNLNHPEMQKKKLKPLVIPPLPILNNSLFC